MVLKALTGKKVGGWSQAGRRGILGLLGPDTVEARGRSVGQLSALPLCIGL